MDCGSVQENHGPGFKALAPPSEKAKKVEKGAAAPHQAQWPSLNAGNPQLWHAVALKFSSGATRGQEAKFTPRDEVIQHDPCSESGHIRP